MVEANVAPLPNLKLDANKNRDVVRRDAERVREKFLIVRVRSVVDEADARLPVHAKVDQLGAGEAAIYDNGPARLVTGLAAPRSQCSPSRSRDHESDP